MNRQQAIQVWICFQPIGIIIDRKLQGPCTLTPTCRLQNSSDIITVLTCKWAQILSSHCNDYGCALLQSHRTNEVGATSTTNRKICRTLWFSDSNWCTQSGHQVCIIVCYVSNDDRRKSHRSLLCRGYHCLSGRISWYSNQQAGAHWKIVWRVYCCSQIQTGDLALCMFYWSPPMMLLLTYNVRTGLRVQHTWLHEKQMCSKSQGRRFNEVDMRAYLLVSPAAFPAGAE